MDNPVISDITTPTLDNLYTTLSQQALQHAPSIAPANVAQRYYEALRYQLAQMTPHRADIATLFSTSMHDEHAQQPFFSDPMRDALIVVVNGSTDAPDKPADKEAFGALLYALYLLVILFWLYDRTPYQNASQQLIEFLRDMIKILRPMLLMPLFTKALMKISTIMGLVFNPRETISG